jgi:hypothetical protein
MLPSGEFGCTHTLVGLDPSFGKPNCSRGGSAAGSALDQMAGDGCVLFGPQSILDEGKNCLFGGASPRRITVPKSNPLCQAADSSGDCHLWNVKRSGRRKAQRLLAPSYSSVELVTRRGRRVARAAIELTRRASTDDNTLPICSRRLVVAIDPGHQRAVVCLANVVAASEPGAWPRFQADMQPLDDVRPVGARRPRRPDALPLTKLSRDAGTFDF